MYLFDICDGYEWIDMYVEFNCQNSLEKEVR